MSIAHNLATYLDDQAIHYSTIHHPESSCSADSARSANIPLHQMIKAILLKQGNNYLVALIPADHRLDLRKINQNRQNHWSKANQNDLNKVFQDCQPGAIPGVPSAYHLSALWDSTIAKNEHVYMESGNHEELISMSKRQFLSLIATQQNGEFSHLSAGYPPSSAQFDPEDNGAEF
ncbi:YbaK/EbsC family protein [Litoribacillus peritrichatus]|uniref:YbaK/EbsC family protein n=1 Tax=Litoribacillus peritrichatus TaxID=718191 RepID=A0ABP7M9C8_9GAMM